ncbi:MAG: ferrous iron transport protein B [Nitrospiraceae bacterium]|nr:MAG: ferrous iron transport protein B [Nitrospiraceae bacterium]
MSTDCHSTTKIKSKAPGMCLVGNPNVGKSAIFGLLTGRYVVVSNYPGTTVEITNGEVELRGDNYQITDTPGVNSLVPMSEDEKVTRDILLDRDFVSVIQVIDSKNIKRALTLTLQLVEMGVPLVVDLNMRDEAANRGIQIEEEELRKIFGVNVVSTIAVQKKGLSTLKDAALAPQVSEYQILYDPLIEKAVEQIAAYLPETNISKRSIALMILSGDSTLKDWLLRNVSDDHIREMESIRDETARHFSTPLSYLISKHRHRLAEGITDRVLSKADKDRKGISKFIDDLTTHPVWGIFVLMFVLYATYEFVGRLGAGIFVDFLEEVVFGEYLNPWVEKLVTLLVPVTFLQELIVGPYGIVTMAITYAIAIILPITTTFFIAFSIMEDSGYLPRLASMLNRVFQTMGLNGKAVLPMVLGLGCDTMATLTTRILDTRKERVIVTLLLALGVPCSAQLGVILGMFGKQPMLAMLIWLGVLIGVIILVGFLAARIIPGQKVDFILELPPIRVPQFSNVLVKTVGRIEWYLKEAVPLFILGTLILFAADKLKILPLVQDAASPLIVGILGLPAEATESFIIGFLRRDFGAAGLFALQERGMLNTEQIVVSLVTITLFIPCIANLFVIIKERGMKTAAIISVFVFPFAILVGGVLHRILTWFKVFG